MTKQHIITLMSRMPSVTIAIAHIPIKFVPRKQLPDALGATDGWQIILRDDLTYEEAVFAVLHELLHIVHGHVWRRGGRDPKIWNIAIDIWVNTILCEYGFQCSYAIQPDRRFVGLTVEEIYNLLVQNPWLMPTISRIDEHLNWDNPENAHGHPMPFTSDDLSDLQNLRHYLAEDMRRYSKHGHVPAGLQRELTRVNAQVDWRTLLWCHINRAVSHAWRWVRKTLLAVTDATLPKRDVRPLRILVGIDTSGSISDADLSAFVAETLLMAKQLRCLLEVAFCDCGEPEVVTIRSANEFNRLAVRCKGGGGTSFVPVFRYLQEQERKGKRYAAVVYFTDTYGDFPDTPPDVPTFWVVTGDQKPPFGIVIPYQRKGDNHAGDN